MIIFVWGLATLVLLGMVVGGVISLYNHPPGKHAWSPEMEIEPIEFDDDEEA